MSASVRFTMHPVLFFSAALAVLASAKPLNKRDVVVEYVTEVKTVTKVVSVNAAAPTITPRRHRYQHVTVTVNAPAVTNTVKPESDPTSEPPPPPPT